MMSQAEVPPQPGLYIGGLRNDLHPARLAGLICSLLWRFQVQVAQHCVHITFKKNEAFSIIDLPDLSVSRFLLSQLSSLDNVHNTFNLNRITFDPNDFKVGPKLTHGHRHRSRSQSNDRNGVLHSVGISGSNTTQHSSSTHSNDSGGRREARSRSDQRNSRGKDREAASNMAQISVSDLSVDAVGTSGKSKRATRRRRRKNRTGFSEANASHSNSSHALMPTPSDASRHSQKSLSSGPKVDDDGLLSESDEDSSPVSRDGSKCSASSRETESREERLEARVLQSGAKLQAGGVRRLVQEFSVDPVSRSMSDRGLHLSVAKTSTTTSTTGLPLPSQVSVTTSTPGAGTGLVSNFYRLGQTIGRETRHSEFKLGGKTRDRSWLLQTVGKYVCGFLNSGEGGTLYLGVNDNGIATGISCPQSKEDEIRLVIDEALKGIDPPIFTDAYSVRFIPLMEPSGHISDCLQVLEVEVKEMKGLNQLYVFRANAFLRRDGSLQGPLKAQQVQEWMRKRLERESSSSLLKSQLREMTSQLEQERDRNSRLQQQLQQLEGCMTQVKLERKKSKICAIM